MKKSFLLSSKAGMAFMTACLSITLLASCSKKNDPQPEPVGEIKVRAVNAVGGSVSQDFYINDMKKGTQPVAYGTSSEYFTVTSGSNVFKFYNAGTTTLSGSSQNYTVPIGVNVTAFYLQAPNGQFGVLALGDDTAVPAAGKAKVRFVYFNRFLATTSVISVTTVGQSSPLIGALGHLLDPNSQVLSYYTVDAGAKFKFAASGITDTPEFDAGLVAGKNYTIWIDGTSSTNLTAHVIVQN